MADYVPTFPERSLQTRLMTYQDVVEAILDRFGRGVVGDDTRDVRMARRAVLDALDDICRPSGGQWGWYKRIMQITLSVAYSTGTIAYDHTGGTNEREVTLTTGTWPSDAAYGWLVISDKWYKVDDRISDTVVTLREDSNPAADVAAETSYTWIRETYPVPPDFWTGFTPLDSERGTSSGGIELVTPDRVIAYNRSYGTSTSADAWIYAFGSDKQRGGTVLYVAPPMSGARTLTIPYQSFGRTPDTYLEERGTVSVTNNTTAVTGVNTSFDSTMVGTVMRFSSNARAATGLVGDLEGQFNPPVMTRIVKSVTNATTLTLDHAADQTLSGVGFTISDVLDIDVQIMGNAFKAGAELYFMTNDRGLIGEHGEIVARADKWYRKQLALAMESDNRDSSIPPSAIWSGYGWYSTFAETSALARRY